MANPQKKGGAESLGLGGSSAGVSAAGESSPWAPLRQRAYRWLWVGVLISYIGTTMQTVGAQWLLIDTPNAAALVALVQAANTVPVMLLAFPAGVLADSFDKRWLMFTVQGYFFVAGLLLVVLTVVGQIPAALLLAFTFALGCGTAVQLPAWQATVPELVPRHQLRSATRLEMVGVNLARTGGPALAGLVIAWFGVSVVFALNAVSVVWLGVALLLWHRPDPMSDSGRERFVPALRAGSRYVWHEPVVRRILLRLTLFILPAAAVWALLPLVASHRLGLGAGGYGALFAALGIGAILGALVLGRVRTRLSSNGIYAAAGVLCAATIAVLISISVFWVAVVALVGFGLAWTATVSSLVAEMALFLPAWVRARGMAVYTMVFTGCQAVGAIIWGLVAQHAGLRTAFLTAAAGALAAVVIGSVWRVPDTGDVDPASVIYWSEARLAMTPEPTDGPVVVEVVYTVIPERQAEYLAAMDQLRQSRRRTGAVRWELFRDADKPTRFVEMFHVSSWEEHIRQHAGRLTAADQTVEEAALAFSDPPARADHLLPP